MINFCRFVNCVSYLKRVSYYVLSSFLIAIIGVLVNPFLSLGLSADDYAIIGYYASFTPLITPILTFQLNVYYSKRFFELSIEDRVCLKNTILSFYLLYGLFALFVFLGLYSYYHIYDNILIPLFPYVILSFLPMYFLSIFNFYILELRLNDQPLEFAKVSILNALAVAALSVCFVYYFDYGIYGRLIPILFVSIIAFVYSVIKLKINLEFSNKSIKPMLSFSFPVFLTAILSYLFIGIDRLFLSKLDDLHELGLYNIALQIAGYLAILGTAIFQAFEPDLYKAVSIKDNKRLFYISLGIAFLISVPNLIFIMIAKYLIYILTVGRYVDSTSYTIILCLKNVTMVLAFLLSTIIVAYGYPRLDFVSKLFGGAITVILYYFMIDSYGYYGAAWGQVLSWVIMCFISIIVFVFIKKIKV